MYISIKPSNHSHNRGNSIHVFYIFDKYSNQSNDPKYPKRILPGYAPWRPAVATDPLGFAPDGVDKGKFAPKNGRRKATIMVVYHICMYIYRQGRCQVRFFPRFWECRVFATSCSIIYVHIPVMVLLGIHTDCQTSSEVAKECPESYEDSQRKGRRKNKHSVCVYIYDYIWLPLGGEVAKEKKSFLASPLS